MVRLRFWRDREPGFNAQEFEKTLESSRLRQLREWGLSEQELQGIAAASLENRQLPEQMMELAGELAPWIGPRAWLDTGQFVEMLRTPREAWNGLSPLDKLSHPQGIDEIREGFYADLGAPLPPQAEQAE